MAYADTYSGTYLDTYGVPAVTPLNSYLPGGPQPSANPLGYANGTALDGLAHYIRTSPDHAQDKRPHLAVLYLTGKPGTSALITEQAQMPQYLYLPSSLEVTGTIQADATVPLNVPGMTAGQTLVSDANGNLTPGSGGGGGGMTNPMTTPGDVIIENATPAAARLAGPTSGTAPYVLTSTPSGGVAQLPAWQLFLDATASDFQGAGNPAAGSAGKAADAGHVHPVVLIPAGVKTANYNASPHDFIPVDTTSASPVITLPTTPANNTTIGVKMVKQPGSNTVVINAGGSDTFDLATGGASKSLSLLNQGSIYQYASASGIWYTIGTILSLTSLDGRYVQGSTPAAPANFKPSNPTGTTSATLVMMGCGSTCAYTPAGSGTVVVNVTGNMQQATTETNNSLGCRYGTGSAPGNGVAVTGTRFGAAGDPGIRPSAAGAGANFAFTDVLNLTAGTAYWFDMTTLANGGANIVTLTNISMTFVEH